MNRLNSAELPTRLDRAVRELCPLIEDRVDAQIPDEWTEYRLRIEFIDCLLGSQVRSETASAWTSSLERAGLLDDGWWSGIQNANFATIVLDVLSGRGADATPRGRYRFYNVRAKQIAQARDALARTPLSARLLDGGAPQQLRRSLVADLPGIGPKQASMLLRNTGVTYELAIIDTHVLRFLELLGLTPRGYATAETMRGYESMERVLVAYADMVGYAVGYVDWAIWITMKAARGLGQ